MADSINNCFIFIIILSMNYKIWLNKFRDKCVYCNDIKLPIYLKLNFQIYVKLKEFTNYTIVGIIYDFHHILIIWFVAINIKIRFYCTCKQTTLVWVNYLLLNIVSIIFQFSYTYVT
jgi:hypothetical protein